MLKIIEGARIKGANPRITYVAGNFFKDAIPPCDAYLLMMVLRDWSDEEAVSVLGNIEAFQRRRPPGSLSSRVWLTRRHARDLLLDIDIEMMALTTGRGRPVPNGQRSSTTPGSICFRIVDVAPWTSIIEGAIR